MVRYSKNFTSVDFPLATPHPEFLGRLQASRDEYGLPITISSGGRTIEDNRATGGVEDSAHIIDENGLFRGADIVCLHSTKRYTLLPILMRHFPRVGVYDKHIHVDDDPTKPQSVCWVGMST